MVVVIADANTTELDLNGLADEVSGVRYIGKATRTFGGIWQCLADVGGALCRVEVHVRPTVHVDGDPGDENDPGRRLR